MAGRAAGAAAAHVQLPLRSVLLPLSSKLTRKDSAMKYDGPTSQLLLLKAPQRRPFPT